MNPESLILRRYSRPVTFADLRAAHERLRSTFNDRDRAMFRCLRGFRHPCYLGRFAAPWHASIKQVTGAIDEVYAVVDGREVRVAVVTQADRDGAAGWSGWPLRTLLEVADEQGYWDRPHEVRLDLSHGGGER
jgi:hypothetical protein